MSSIDFYGKTNKNYVMINTMTFRLENGKEVTIDRQYTGYDIDEDGNLGMTWRGCYFWDDNHSDDYNNPDYLTEDDVNDIIAAELIAVDIEDDADPDYEVTIEVWN